MKTSDKSPERIQEDYYNTTAARYDAMHTADLDDEHFTALRFISALSNLYGLRTFLDVGAGTGRGVRFFLDKGLQVRGIEPVLTLIELAERAGIPPGLIMQGSGYSLPFEDHSFDAVTELGVLHHVKDPSRVISQMTRVARKAIFLSDANRFGQGCYASRLLKLVLCKSHLWTASRFIQTRGKHYTISEGDGLAYSYSVFDSYEQLTQWADHIILMPTSSGSQKSWLHPLLTSPSVLLCAIKC